MQIKRTTKSANGASKARSRLSERRSTQNSALTETTRTPDRSSRTRTRTRQKLIDAAHRVIGLKGVDATTINDITEEADVGLGSFYNHFSSKDELVRVVFANRAEELGKIFDEISMSVSDPALVVGYIQRLFLEKVRLDSAWGWFALHAELALQQMDLTFSERARKDLRRGVNEGRFTLESVDIAAQFIMATLLALMRAVLEGRNEPALVIRSIELQLRMLGVSVEEAREIVERPLPKIAQSFLSP